MRQHEPVFNVHPAIVGAIALLGAVHAALAFIPEPDMEWWQVALAFVPARYVGYADQIPGGQIASASSFVTHMLVHGDLLHLAFNSAWFLAFGGALARRIGPARCLLLTVFCGIAGAAAFLVARSGSLQEMLVPMVGASGGISGLMGGIFRYLFNARGPVGLWQLGNSPRSIPTMPLAQALHNRRVLAAVGVWIAVNLLAIYGIGTPAGSGGIAWEAHIGGFLAGFVAFSLFEGPQSPQEGSQEEGSAGNGGV